MSLEGAYLSIESSDGITVSHAAKGRKFNIGSYLDCHLVLPDAERIHCEIQCDAFGRVTICNHAQEPILLNDQIVHSTTKRPLLHGSRIGILNNVYTWHYSKATELITPERCLVPSVPEQAPNSSPSFKRHRPHRQTDNRLTIHNFRYSINSDDDTSMENREIESRTNISEKPTSCLAEAELIDAKTAAGIQPKRSITPTTQVADEAVTTQVDLMETNQNKENTSTPCNRLMLQFCKRSDLVITSFSPRITGVKIQKSFTCVIKPSTSGLAIPKSVYNTPKSVLSELNDDSCSREPNEYSTPTTSHSGGIEKSSMYLIDLTTPQHLRPKLNETQTPSSPGIISVDSTVESFVISPIVIDHSTCMSSTASPVRMRPNTSTMEHLLGTSSTPKRTPQTLMKRALLTSANKKLASPVIKTTRVSTPVRPSLLAARRQYLTAPRCLPQAILTPDRRRRTANPTKAPHTSPRKRLSGSLNSPRDTKVSLLRKSLRAGARVRPSIERSNQLVAKARRALNSPKHDSTHKKGSAGAETPTKNDLYEFTPIKSLTMEKSGDSATELSCTFTIIDDDENPHIKDILTDEKILNDDDKYNMEDIPTDKTKNIEPSEIVSKIMTSKEAIDTPEINKAFEELRDKDALEKQSFGISLKTNSAPTNTIFIKINENITQSKDEAIHIIEDNICEEVTVTKSVINEHIIHDDTICDEVPLLKSNTSNVADVKFEKSVKNNQKEDIFNLSLRRSSRRASLDLSSKLGVELTIKSSRRASFSTVSVASSPIMTLKRKRSLTEELATPTQKSDRLICNTSKRSLLVDEAVYDMGVIVEERTTYTQTEVRKEAINQADKIVFYGMQELMKTPKGCSPPRLKGLCELMHTPKEAASPIFDNIKELLQEDSKSVSGEAHDLTATAKNVIIPCEPYSDVLQTKNKCLLTTEYDMNVTNVSTHLCKIFDDEPIRINPDDLKNKMFVRPESPTARKDSNVITDYLSASSATCSLTSETLMYRSDAEICQYDPLTDNSAENEQNRLKSSNKNCEIELKSKFYKFNEGSDSESLVGLTEPLVFSDDEEEIQLAKEEKSAINQIDVNESSTFNDQISSDNYKEYQATCIEFISESLARDMQECHKEKSTTAKNKFVNTKDYAPNESLDLHNKRDEINASPYYESSLLKSTPKDDSKNVIIISRPVKLYQNDLSTNENQKEVTKSNKLKPSIDLSVGELNHIELNGIHKTKITGHEYINDAILVKIADNKIHETPEEDRLENIIVRQADVTASNTKEVKAHKVLEDQSITNPITSDLGSEPFESKSPGIVFNKAPINQSRDGFPVNLNYSSLNTSKVVYQMVDVSVMDSTNALNTNEKEDFNKNSSVIDLKNTDIKIDLQPEPSADITISSYSEPNLVDSSEDINTSKVEPHNKKALEVQLKYTAIEIVSNTNTNAHQPSGVSVIKSECSDGNVDNKVITASSDSGPKLVDSPEDLSTTEVHNDDGSEAQSKYRAIEIESQPKLSSSVAKPELIISATEAYNSTVSVLTMAVDIQEVTIKKGLDILANASGTNKNYNQPPDVPVIKSECSDVNVHIKVETASSDSGPKLVDSAEELYKNEVEAHDDDGLGNQSKYTVIAEAHNGNAGDKTTVNKMSGDIQAVTIKNGLNNLTKASVTNTNANQPSGVSVIKSECSDGNVDNKVITASADSGPKLVDSAEDLSTTEVHNDDGAQSKYRAIEMATTTDIDTKSVGKMSDKNVLSIPKQSPSTSKVNLQITNPNEVADEIIDIQALTHHKDDLKIKGTDTDVSHSEINSTNTVKEHILSRYKPQQSEELRGSQKSSKEQMVKKSDDSIVLLDASVSEEFESDLPNAVNKASHDNILDCYKSNTSKQTCNTDRHNSIAEKARVDHNSVYISESTKNIVGSPKKSKKGVVEFSAKETPIDNPGGKCITCKSDFKDDFASNTSNDVTQPMNNNWTVDSSKKDDKCEDHINYERAANSLSVKTKNNIAKDEYEENIDVSIRKRELTEYSDIDQDSTKVELSKQREVSLEKVNNKSTIDKKSGNCVDQLSSNLELSDVLSLRKTKQSTKHESMSKIYETQYEYLETKTSKRVDRISSFVQKHERLGCKATYECVDMEVLSQANKKKKHINEQILITKPGIDKDKVFKMEKVAPAVATDVSMPKRGNRNVSDDVEEIDNHIERMPQKIIDVDRSNRREKKMTTDNIEKASSFITFGRIELKIVEPSKESRIRRKASASEVTDDTKTPNLTEKKSQRNTRKATAERAEHEKASTPALNLIEEKADSESKLLTAKEMPEEIEFPKSQRLGRKVFYSKKHSEIEGKTTTIKTFEQSVTRRRCNADLNEPPLQLKKTIDPDGELSIKDQQVKFVIHPARGRRRKLNAEDELEDSETANQHIKNKSMRQGREPLTNDGMKQQLLSMQNLPTQLVEPADVVNVSVSQNLQPVNPNDDLTPKRREGRNVPRKNYDETSDEDKAGPSRKAIKSELKDVSLSTQLESSTDIRPSQKREGRNVPRKNYNEAWNEEKQLRSRRLRQPTAKALELLVSEAERPLTPNRRRVKTAAADMSEEPPIKKVTKEEAMGETITPVKVGVVAGTVSRRRKPQKVSPTAVAADLAKGPLRNKSREGDGYVGSLPVARRGRRNVDETKAVETNASIKSKRCARSCKEIASSSITIQSVNGESTKSAKRNGRRAKLFADNSLEREQQAIMKLRGSSRAKTPIKPTEEEQELKEVSNTNTSRGRAKATNTESKVIQKTQPTRAGRGRKVHFEEVTEKVTASATVEPPVDKQTKRATRTRRK
ncbi:uncharacterized protein LOC117135097 isoform X2 [Drosophila busckii]|uniref:uncharacterized protein LOC117135097 isoform X2 n=1 Tax=Drosophila busckii TaxID=30019 RepID=UPI0014328AA1|nr:uncharacterized protein LOC117135097 isoform X2 [Drosophila busckii]